MERKQQIRAALKEKRRALSPEQVQNWSDAVCRHLLQAPLVLDADIIYFYYPLGKEVSLLPLAEGLLQAGKRIAFPRTKRAGDFIPGRREPEIIQDMEFYQVSSLSEFQTGAFGIMEPEPVLKSEEKDPLVLVPGLGFDRQGNRMGYGKGYYDRYFSRYPECRKIGIAYTFQVVDELLAGPLDVPMDFIATEQGINEVI